MFFFLSLLCHRKHVFSPINLFSTFHQNHFCHLTVGNGIQSTSKWVNECLNHTRWEMTSIKWVDAYIKLWSISWKYECRVCMPWKLSDTCEHFKFSQMENGRLHQKIISLSSQWVADWYLLMFVVFFVMHINKHEEKRRTSSHHFLQ